VHNYVSSSCAGECSLLPLRVRLLLLRRRGLNIGWRVEPALATLLDAGHQDREDGHVPRSRRSGVLLSRPVSAAGVPPSESNVKRGDRVVGVDTELTEKLGRDDLCACGSGRRFPPVLPEHRPVRRRAKPSITSVTAASSEAFMGNSLRCGQSRLHPSERPGMPLSVQVQADEPGDERPAR